MVGVRSSSDRLSCRCVREGVALVINSRGFSISANLSVSWWEILPCCEVELWEQQMKEVE